MANQFSSESSDENEILELDPHLDLHKRVYENDENEDEIETSLNQESEDSMDIEILSNNSTNFQFKAINIKSEVLEDFNVKQVLDSNAIDKKEYSECFVKLKRLTEIDLRKWKVLFFNGSCSNTELDLKNTKVDNNVKIQFEKPKIFKSVETENDFSSESDNENSNLLEEPKNYTTNNIENLFSSDEESENNDLVSIPNGNVNDMKYLPIKSNVYQSNENLFSSDESESDNLRIVDFEDSTSTSEVVNNEEKDEITNEGPNNKDKKSWSHIDTENMMWVCEICGVKYCKIHNR